MTRMVLIVLGAGGLMLAAFFYITTAERAKIENANTKNTIEGIRDAREIENETRNAGDDDLRRILIDGL